MKQIKIGTCVPGTVALKQIPGFLNAGFECFSLNFHMDLGDTDLKVLAKDVKRLLEGSNATISSIGFYCNALQNADQRRILEDFIAHAHLFETSVVTTFAGALEGESVDASIPTYKKVFSELAKHAEAHDVKIAIENCPMDGTWERATCNIGFNPLAWEKMFNAVDHPAIGLEWEPAHQMIQLIDPIEQLPHWMDRIYHIHGKDTTIDWYAIKKWGVFGAKNFAVQRTPGFGDTDWRDILFQLYKHGYQGDICVEGFHDPIYREEKEMTGQIHALNYLKWCRGGDFVPNPWEAEM